MNQLTPEQLDMIKRLQSLFKEKMGEWQIRDEGWAEGLGVGVLYHNGLMYFDNGTRVNPMWCDDILHIPKPIDPWNPERGLWKMVDWKKYYGEIMPSGDIWIYQQPIQRGRSPKFIGDPFTALLKALCEQEGV